MAEQIYKVHLGRLEICMIALCKNVLDLSLIYHECRSLIEYTTHHLYSVVDI